MNSSPLDQLIHHRGVTHSILFTVLAPLPLIYISKKIIKSSLTTFKWYWFWFLIFSTHIFLDLLTTWGTQIYWPWPGRAALNSVFIIDPFLTIPLILGCIFTKLKNKHRFIYTGVLLSSIYIIFALGTHHFMKIKFFHYFESKIGNVEKLMVHPTPFNTLYWSAVALSDTDQLYFSYARIWDKDKDIMHSHAYNRNSHLLKSYQNNEISTLLNITNDFYIIKKVENNIIIKDARFGIFGGWESFSDTFIFNYQLDLDNLIWTQYRDAPQNNWKLLKSLIKNILM